MYAIIRAGGKQAKVSEGDVIAIERIKTAHAEVTYTPLRDVQDDGTVIAERAAPDQTKKAAKKAAKDDSEKAEKKRKKAKASSEEKAPKKAAKASKDKDEAATDPKAEAPAAETAAGDEEA